MVISAQDLTNLITLLAVVIAFVALWRQGRAMQKQLAQADKQLQLTEAQLRLMQNQFLSTVPPIIEINIGGTIQNEDCYLKLTNSGSVDVVNARLIGCTSAVFRSGHGFVEKLCKRTDVLITDRLCAHTQVDFPLIHVSGAHHDHTLVSHVNETVIPPKGTPQGGLCGYAYVVEFRRAVDMKPFYRVYPCLRTQRKDRETGKTIYSFAPMRAAPHSSSYSAGAITISDEFRKAMLSLCEEEYDLGASEAFEYSKVQ